MSDFDCEPIRGLPEPLPPGEQLRWQGAPRWSALAKRAFHVRLVAIYFGLLILWRIGAGWFAGESREHLVGSGLWLLALALAAIGILALLAWFYARSTIYSITDRRVIIRFGLALPMAVNIPFKSIETAGLRVYADGTGDLPLALIEGQQVGYFVMWPNVRPWSFIRKTQPMLRALPDAEQAAEILAAALTAALAADQAVPDDAAPVAATS